MTVFWLAHRMKARCESADTVAAPLKPSFARRGTNQGLPVSPLKPSFASAGTNADGLFPRRIRNATRLFGHRLIACDCRIPIRPNHTAQGVLNAVQVTLR